MKKIFLGGTGRSGTSVTARIIGSHPDLYHIPLETRFMCDADSGMRDLFTALTSNYSPESSGSSLERFVNLINSMSNPYSAPFIGYNLSEIFENGVVAGELNHLVNAIIEGKYNGWDRHVADYKYSFKPFIRRILACKPAIDRLPILGKITKRYDIRYKDIVQYSDRYIVKYFSDEDKLLSIFIKFVDSIFGGRTASLGKIGWCESTPQNILYVDFLHKLYPDAYFVHCVRHPVGVVQSWRERSWGPEKLDQLCDYMVNYYTRMEHSLNYANDNANLLTLRMERMDSDSLSTELGDFLKVSHNFDKSIVFDGEKILGWDRRISKKDRDYVEFRLSKYIELFGYDA